MCSSAHDVNDICICQIRKGLAGIGQLVRPFRARYSWTPLKTSRAARGRDSLAA